MRRTIMIGVLIVGLTGAAQAALIDRGNGLIYDDVLNVTWLQDAGLGGYQSGDVAATWADDLVFGGYDDWRLPSMDVNGDGTIVDCTFASEADCRDNELGYMFYHNLLGTLGNNLSGDHGLIENLQFRHWSGTESIPDGYWVFVFFNGFQTSDLAFQSNAAWAVRPGDVDVMQVTQTYQFAVNYTNGATASGAVTITYNPDGPRVDDTPTDSGVASVLGMGFVDSDLGFDWRPDEPVLPGDHLVIGGIVDDGNASGVAGQYVDFSFLFSLDDLSVVGAIHSNGEDEFFDFVDAVVINITDSDGDGVPDSDDNCVEIDNADQRDFDADGIGSSCDADLTNDCTVNFLDLNEVRTVFFSTDPNADLNGDGQVNFIDLGVMSQEFFADYSTDNPSGVSNICDGD